MNRSIVTFALSCSIIISCPSVSFAGDKPVSKKEAAAATTTSSIVETPSHLKYRDDKVGTGAVAEKGKSVAVHYTGWLDKAGEKGKKFDSSHDHGSPFSFKLGAGQVIAGWDEGVAGMKIGGTRTLMIPSALGYGSRGAGGVIPPNADLLFEVELLEVK